LNFFLAARRGTAGQRHGQHMDGASARRRRCGTPVVVALPSRHHDPAAPSPPPRPRAHGAAVARTLFFVLVRLMELAARACEDGVLRERGGRGGGETAGRRGAPVTTRCSSSARQSARGAAELARTRRRRAPLAGVAPGCGARCSPASSSSLHFPCRRAQKSARACGQLKKAEVGRIGGVAVGTHSDRCSRSTLKRQHRHSSTSVGRQTCFEDERAPRDCSLGGAHAAAAALRLRLLRALGSPSDATPPARSQAVAPALPAHSDRISRCIEKRGGGLSPAAVTRMLQRHVLMPRLPWPPAMLRSPRLYPSCPALAPLTPPAPRRPAPHAARGP
jgi:hypothetical protein